ncbi:MAG: hypothetical protein HY895_10755 [Deltaproteobacteria bacterium]|nr:hypothetical protein [Deltaproteobacteria bacterium]
MDGTKDYFPEKPRACKCGCGFDHIDQDLVKRLNFARELAGVPFEINSACRCEKHNAAEGGKPGSAHTTVKAVDIKVHNNKHRYFVLVGRSGPESSGSASAATSFTPTWLKTSPSRSPGPTEAMK